MGEKMKDVCKCGHRVNQHDFSHSSECREDKCKCKEVKVRKNKSYMWDITKEIIIIVKSR